MPYIKSHSNFVLKSKHQDINDGTIFERDITTIGGVNQFSKGQTPIYRSNNFIITVRNYGRVSNQYNTSKWKSNDSGETWTLQTLSGMVSDFEEEDDTKIVLKQDYYDFRDFAYYGSLTELFRASVTDIVARFPGELYVTNENAYYTERSSHDFDRVENRKLLGGKEYHLVSNPFGINIHSLSKPYGANPLKYFAEEGYMEYQTSTDGENWSEIESWEVTPQEPCSLCTKITVTIGGDATRGATRGANDEDEDINENDRRVAIINIGGIEISAYLGDNDTIVYLTKEGEGLHIRPMKKDKPRYYLDKFYDECDNFQRLLVNEDNGYCPTFSVIRENDYGYYREFVPFKFPTDAGGYNLDATDYGFNAYTTQMVQIGEYYDENFTDNLWRSMTHEAIKNFDWTYTREYVEGDEEEYVLGGQRIQKALRIFGREFDEIISYINNIRNINRVTYDERSNLPDYFLTDTVESEGWDVKLVYPYELTEYYVTDSGRTVVSASSFDEKNQLDNKIGDNNIVRDFSQNTTNTTTPYTKWMIDDGTENGYFIVCDGSGTLEHCGYEGSSYTFRTAEASASTYYDDKAFGIGALKNKIKSYTDETEWTYQNVNNEFLRRLKLNSREIWRHKGTIDGIEMVLGMFGMKSRRWVEAHPNYIQDCRFSGISYDYEVQEYTSFAERIEEEWDVAHQDYRINWINSTKTITYDNRFVSNYNKYGANQNMLTYQGIPVAYREAYVSQEGDNAYLKYDNSNYYHDISNNRIIKRYLYPYFDKNEQLDGNPYYQMDGGWLSKTITYNNEKKYNFQFDISDNIVYNEYVARGEVADDGTITDNHPLFKETIRNIRRVDNIASLLSIPTMNLYNGIICNVTRIETDSAVIDNVVYPITKVWDVEQGESGETRQYISFVKTDGYVRVGNSKFFDTTLIAYDADYSACTYNIEEKSDGYELKAYISATCDSSGACEYDFICQEDPEGNYSISNFQVLEQLLDVSGATNYFILDDVNYADVLAYYDESISGYTSGWRMLTEQDSEYLKVNTITNYYKGNNPHNGNMVYDNGHEYFTYFKRLFKYSSDNELFDERCYDDYFDVLDNKISKYGFSGMIEDNEDIKQYDGFLVPDSKIHYFGNYKTRNEEDNTIDRVWIYGDDTYMLSGTTENPSGYNAIYINETGDESKILNYNLSSASGAGWIEEDNPYDPASGYTSRASVIDDITKQIVNNKIFDITFILHNVKDKGIEWFTQDGQEQIKYIDDVVMNYLTQVIPSTTILRVNYETRTE